MVDAIQNLGRLTISHLSGIGRAFLMLLSAILRVPNPRKGWPLLVAQLYSVGVLSLLIIIVSGLFIGMVIALQGYTILNGYGAEGRTCSYCTTFCW